MSEQKTCKACKKTYMVDPYPFVCDGCRNTYIDAREGDIRSWLDTILGEYVITANNARDLRARARDLQNELQDVRDRAEREEQNLDSIVRSIAEQSAIRSMPFPTA